MEKTRMTVYPRKYGVSASGAVEPLDWDGMVDRINGFTPGPGTTGNYPGAPHYTIYSITVDAVTTYYIKDVYGNSTSFSNAATAINAAFAAAGASYLIKCSCTVDDDLLLPSNASVTLEGTITSTYSGNVFFGDTISNLKFQGGTINPKTGGVYWAIRLKDCINCTIQNVASTSGDYGFSFDSGCRKCVIENCNVQDLGQQGINISGYGNIAQNNYLKGGCDQFAMVIGEGYGLKAINNVFENFSLCTGVLELGYYSESCILSGNEIIEGITCVGIIVYSKPGSLALTSLSKAQIVYNNISVSGANVDGIYVMPNSGDYPLTDLTLAFNKVTSANRNAITITRNGETAGVKYARVFIHNNTLNASTNAVSQDFKDVYVHDNNIVAGALDTCIAAEATNIHLKNNSNSSLDGVVAAPFGQITGSIYTFGLTNAGTYPAAAPTTTVKYVVYGCDGLLNSTGGSGCTVLVQDVDGATTIYSAATATMLPVFVGQYVTFTFSSAPTVQFIAVNP
jgi:hypothetical protein